MGNINVNRNTSDPSDNVIRRYAPSKTDPRHYALAVILIAVTAFVIDLVFWLMMKVECYWSCGDMVIVWKVWTGIIAIGAITGVCIGLYNWLKNSAFVEVARIKLHRSDIRKYATKLLENDAISAASEASAGWDNFSPAYHNTAKTENNSSIDTNGLQFSDEIALGTVLHE